MLTFVGLAWPGSKCYIIKQVVMSFHIIGPGQARPEISTDKTDNVAVRPVKTQISLGIRPV